jgi:hypothetical protein
LGMIGACDPGPTFVVFCVRLQCVCKHSENTTKAWTFAAPVCVWNQPFQENTSMRECGNEANSLYDMLVHMKRAI